MIEYLNNFENFFIDSVIFIYFMIELYPCDYFTNKSNIAALAKCTYKHGTLAYCTQE